MSFMKFRPRKLPENYLKRESLVFQVVYVFFIILLFQAKLIWSQRDDSTVKSVSNYPRLGWTETWEDESDIEEEENKIAIDWEAKKSSKPISNINEKKSKKKMQENQVS